MSQRTPNKNNNMSFNEAIIPQKTKEKIFIQNLEQFKEFDSEQISQEKKKQYLEFCEKIFPTKGNEFGILFNQNINSHSALKFLHQNKYNMRLTKFKLLYPALFQYMSYQNLEPEMTDNELNLYITEIDRINEPIFTSEDEIKNRLEIMIQNNSTHITQQTFTDTLSKQKQKSQKMIEYSKNLDNLNKKIQNIIDKPFKTQFELNQLIQECDQFSVLPNNYQQLKSIVVHVNMLIYKIENFVSLENIEVEKLFDLKNELDCLKIQLNPSIEKQQKFLDQWNQTKEIFVKIDFILANPISNQKIDMNSLCKIMNFFQNNNLTRHKKLQELIQFVQVQERKKENCFMWAEDDRNNHIQHDVQELNECVLDQKNDFHYVNQKYNSLLIIQRLEQNMNDFSFLFENLELIQEYKNKKLFWKKNVIEKYESFLHLIKLLDQKVEKMNSIQTTLEDYIMLDIEFENIENFNSIFDKLGNLEVNGEYLDKVKNYINEFKKEFQILEGYQTMKNQVFFEKIKKIISYSIKNEPLSETLKNEFKYRMKFEIFQYLFMKEYYKKTLDYPYHNLVSCFIQDYPEFQSIDQGFEFFDKEKKLLQYSSLQDIYDEFKKEYIMDSDMVYEEGQRQMIDRTQIYQQQLIVQQEENGNSNGVENDHVINLESQDFIKTFNKNFKKKFPIYMDEEKELYKILDDETKSKEFFKSHIKKIRQYYYSAKKTRIDLYQRDFDYLENVLNSKYQHQIEQILELIKKYKNIYLQYKDYTQVGKQYFILKLPLFIIIYYRLRILGFNPDFLNPIVEYIEENLNLDRFFEFKVRLTFYEAQENFKEYQIQNKYNVEFNLLKFMIELFLIFERSVKIMQKIHGQFRITSHFLKNIFRKNCKIQNYVIDFFDTDIILNRHFHSFIPNEEDFFNSKSKCQQNYPDFSTSKFLSNPIMSINKQNEINCFCGISYSIQGEGCMRFACGNSMHDFCIQKNFQEKIENCPICDLMKGKKIDSIKRILKQKVSQEFFEEILQAYFYLNRYLKDQTIDYMRSIQKRISTLSQNWKLIKQTKDQEQKTILIHHTWIIYISLPFRLEKMEKKLKEMNIDIQQIFIENIFLIQIILFFQNSLNHLLTFIFVQDFILIILFLFLMMKFLIFD